MKKFVTGKINNGYSITNNQCLCEVKGVSLGGNCIDLKVVAHTFNNNLNFTCVVPVDDMTEITSVEYFAKYPNAYTIPGYDYEIDNTIKEGLIKNQPTDDMDIENTFVLSDEKRFELTSEMMDLLEEYNYHPTSNGLNEIIDEWVKNKGKLISIMEHHPNYNGNFQIHFDTDYNREIDHRVINRFYLQIKNHLLEYARQNETKLCVFSYSEVNKICDKLNCQTNLLSELALNCSEFTPYFKKVQKELDRFYSYKTQYNLLRTMESHTVLSDLFISKEIYDKIDNINKMLDCLSQNIEQFLNDDLTNFANKYVPHLKPHKGAKVSRLVNAICKDIGFDKTENYNREFAKFADAINPAKIIRHTVISAHPVDFYTMSFGNSWASCHTIDKENLRGMPNDYTGCYSGGTESYMLDGTSLVFYTLEREHNDKNLELKPKVNRNMFHIGKEKIIQGRVYPQSTDGENGVYKQYREIMQKVISDCLDIPNLWSNKKGVGICGKSINSKGVHYKDYIAFEDCNVSYVNYDKSKNINEEKIIVGHNPICPCCGEEHINEKCIECNDCYEGKYCIICGATCEELHEIDGAWYCENHCFYCDYHGEWERYPESNYYVENYGYVCQSAIECGEFNICDGCNSYYHCNDIQIHAEDDYTFCCVECAEEAGYIEVDGVWHYKACVEYCNHCENYVLLEDYNDDEGMCNNCLEEERRNEEIA